MGNALEKMRQSMIDPNHKETPRRRTQIFTVDCLKYGLEMGRVDMTDPVAFMERSLNYLEVCAQREAFPQLPGWALFLGLPSKNKLSAIHSRREEGIRNVSPEVCEAVDLIYTAIEASTIAAMQEGEMNVGAAVFTSVNHQQGYVNYKSKIEQVSTSSIEDSRNYEQIEAEILDITSQDHADVY